MHYALLIDLQSCLDHNNLKITNKNYIHTCFLLAYPRSFYVASDALKFPVRTCGPFFSNESVVTVSTRFRIPPFYYSQRSTVDPSPVTNFCVPKQPNVPLIFCCCPILELIRDKLPLSLSVSMATRSFLLYLQEALAVGHVTD